MSVSGYLALPKNEEINWDIGNPAFNHQSDHYAISFKFLI
jgi:hypothetical protein